MLRCAVLFAFAILLLAGAAFCADNTPAVKCDKATAGTFWPEAANTDHTVRTQAERCGTLLYCERTTFSWKWRPLTVSVQSLLSKASGTPQTPAAGCGELTARREPAPGTK